MILIESSFYINTTITMAIGITIIIITIIMIYWICWVCSSKEESAGWNINCPPGQPDIHVDHYHHHHHHNHTSTTSIIIITTIILIITNTILITIIITTNHQIQIQMHFSIS